MAAIGEWYSWDKLDSLTGELKAELALQSSRPKIILVHCIAGADRTGSVAMAYRVRFEKITVS